MYTRPAVRVAAWTAALALAGSSLVSRAELQGVDEGFSVAGDLRLRTETDFDSRRADRKQREDRTRVRVRARVGLEYEAAPFTFGLRLRSGSDDSQQSPHITVVDFDGNDTGDADFNPDQWYLAARSESWWGWAGRNSFPFWRRNELFWDSDVTPAGLAGGYDGTRWGVKAGYFSLPVGMQEFTGNLGAVQLTGEHSRSGVDFTGATGLFLFDADPDDPDAALLLAGNGSRDYTIWVTSLQAAWRVGARRIAVGGDVFINSEDYDATEPARDEDIGYVLSAVLGQTERAGDWQVGYHYARIEELAVNSSVAQDDWVRWGTANQTRGSDLEGHELRFGYGLAKNLDVLARLYIVDSITTPEDGNRFRVDLNFSF